MEHEQPPDGPSPEVPGPTSPGPASPGSPSSSRSRPTPPYISKFIAAERRENPSTAPNTYRDDWQIPFLDAYSRKPSIMHACKVAKVHHDTFLAERKRNPDFAASFEVARMMAADRLVEIAWEIAEGTEEDVYYKGIVVGKRVVRDPDMVKFLLRAFAPDPFDPRVRAVGEMSRYAADNDARAKMLAEGKERLKLLGKIIESPDGD